MNLSEMIDRLRARLNERVGPDAFRDDEDLIPLLNEGARYVAKKVNAINRKAHVVFDYADITAGVRRYPMPEDYLFEIEVWYGDPTQVEDLFTRPEKLVCVEPGRGKRGYFMDGMWMTLTFAPPLSIPGGLLLKHCNAISMIDGGDIPAIPQDLHMAIVVAAERYAVPQVGEAAKQQFEELVDLLGDLSNYYKVENGEQPGLMPVYLGKKRY